MRSPFDVGITAGLVYKASFGRVGRADVASATIVEAEPGKSPTEEEAAIKVSGPDSGSRSIATQAGAMKVFLSQSGF